MTVRVWSNRMARVDVVPWSMARIWVMSGGPPLGDVFYWSSFSGRWKRIKQEKRLWGSGRGVRAPIKGSLLPGLDQLIIGDGLRFFVLVLELGIRRTRLVEPVLRVPLFVHDRTDVSLHACALKAFHHALLVSTQRIQRLLSGFRTGHGVADVLPPQLSQLWIVRHVGAGGRPCHTRRRAVEFDQTA